MATWLRPVTVAKKVLRPWKDSYRPEISPDEFIQIHLESMENGTGLVFHKFSDKNLCDTRESSNNFKNVIPNFYHWKVHCTGGEWPGSRSVPLIG